MKLAIDPSVVSSRQTAVVVGLLAGAASIAGWPCRTVWMRVAVGLTGIVLGVIISKTPVWFVAHPARRVLLQIQNTLQATCVEHHVLDNSVQVVATGTTANVRRCGPFSWVWFHVVDPNSNKERFLLEVLTKYLRFIGKADADG